MLYMLADNAEDALTRMKTNPKLLSLATSQSSWDNASALKQYGWTETKNSANWAYIGVNDVMQELWINTASKSNSNVQLVQCYPHFRTKWYKRRSSTTTWEQTFEDSLESPSTHALLETRRK